ncbi:MAG TPA: MFS transporter [Nocardioidaceae bacterium]|nr:MFS transporter [Nocardioidaceae bacterium]
MSQPGNVLHNRDFRKLWIGLGLSSLGDWLGLLALTAMANAFADSYAGKNYAIATVLFLRVLPPLVVGPLAGYVADRLDRRTTLVWGDFIRGALFVSIPVVGTLWWVFVVTVLVELVSVVWGPAKDATVPNLVSKEQLEQANQVSLVTTYGSALPAAAIFAGLTFVDRVWPNVLDWMGGAVDAALYFNGISFTISGLVILGLHNIPRGPASQTDDNVLKVITDGWAYVARTPVVRGLIIGITGAFMAGGAVIGLARTLVADLDGGDSGYGLLFGAVFAGLGAGMWKGPSITRFTRPQLFAGALTATGLLLFPVALVPYLEIVTVVAVALGFCAGTAWVTGNTLLGLEVPDEVRGRTFAFVGSLTKLSLALVLAVAPLVAGSVGTVDVGPTYHGAAVTIFLAAVLMSVVGAVSYRQMHQPSKGPAL